MPKGRPAFPPRAGVTVLLSCVLLCACARDRLARYEYRRVIMGVDARLTFFARSDDQAGAIASAAFDRLGWLDAVMSDYRRDSELNHLAAAPSGLPVPISDDLQSVLRTALRASSLTQGAFDPTCGPLVALWREARKAGALPDSARIARARSNVGTRFLDVILRQDAASPGAAILRAPDMRLDLGGIGKGYAAAQARDAIQHAGAPRCLVALAGDVAAGSPPPGQPGWEVALGAGGRTVGVLLISNLSVSTAGDTEQFTEINGVRFSHIIDPRTGMASVNAPCVTVISPDGAMADALDTGLVVLGKRPAWRIMENLPDDPPCAVVVFDPDSREPPLVTGRVDLVRWKAE